MYEPSFWIGLIGVGAALLLLTSGIRRWKQRLDALKAPAYQAQIAAYLRGERDEPPPFDPLNPQH